MPSNRGSGASEARSKATASPTNTTTTTTNNTTCRNELLQNPKQAPDWLKVGTSTYA